MDDLDALITRRAELDRQIEAIQAERRAELLAQARNALRALGVSAAEIMPARASRKAPRTVAIKYRNAEGKTWTGRGHKPVWLMRARNTGAHLDDFKV